jgi:hypothetical protein
MQTLDATQLHTSFVAYACSTSATHADAATVSETDVTSYAADIARLLPADQAGDAQHIN